MENDFTCVECGSVLPDTCYVMMVYVKIVLMQKNFLLMTLNIMNCFLILNARPA